MDPAQVPRLRRDLACNRSRLGRVLPRGRSHVAIPAAQIDQRDLDQKPESNQCDQRPERYRRAGRLGPDKQVQDEDHTEGQPGEQ